MRRRRYLCPLLLLLFGLASRPAPAATELVDFLVADLEIERELMADDLRLYSAAQSARAAADEQLATALAAMDDLLDAQQVTVGELERLEGEITAARQAADSAHDRATVLRRRLVDRLRRTALIAERISRQAPDVALRIDRVSGVWEIEVEPQDVSGELDLRLNGALLTGVYQLDDGTAGSLRGTAAAGTLQFTQIDGTTGIDSTWDGEMDGARMEIRGTWTRLDLTADGPATGTWTARKKDGSTP